VDTLRSGRVLIRYRLKPRGWLPALRKMEPRIIGMATAAAKAVVVSLLVAGAGADVAVAQDTGRVKFEVASVRPGDRNDDTPAIVRGGPGTSDPERITYERQSLLRLLTIVYGLDFDQVTGPDWLGTELYTVLAKVPPGTTKEQLKLMWQDLLVERFHLKAHVIKKDFPVYELSVAKGGAKLRKSGEGPVKQEPGFPVPPAGQKWGVLVAPPRNTRLTFRDYSMNEFVREQLAWPLCTFIESYRAIAMGRVVDKTDLDGKYDFTLEYAGRRNSPGGAFPQPLPDGETDTAPYLFDALRQQLGLILKEGKAALDVLVVDHADRVPTEN
jgi:uncharacterized protein (TIGR03435 family)